MSCIWVWVMLCGLNYYVELVMVENFFGIVVIELFIFQCNNGGVDLF